MTDIVERAREYATNLLVHFANEHCAPVPEWKPLPDLLGVLTQLDNAITIARDYKAEIERLRENLNIMQRHYNLNEKASLNRETEIERLYDAKLANAQTDNARLRAFARWVQDHSNDPGVVKNARRALEPNK